MRKQVCFLFLLILLLTTGFRNAQNGIQACPDSPLKGLTKLFVDTGDDLESRSQIIDVIGKEFPTMTIVEQKEHAEIVITYSYRVERRETDGVMETQVRGDIDVITGKGQYRNVTSNASSGPCGFGYKEEARRFARRFIDIYEGYL
jgi:hypothetical protein